MPAIWIDSPQDRAHANGEEVLDLLSNPLARSTPSAGQTVTADLAVGGLRRESAPRRVFVLFLEI
jgi:hypothetical protein